MSPSLRIIAADDEKDVREYYQDLLPRLGHQVIVAESGEQLLALCRVGAPDLVITDIRMAGLDGLAAVAQATAERPVPVILVSAHQDPGLRGRAREGAVMAYLTKPVRQADLELAIDLARVRFEQVQQLTREAADLRRALEDRKVIEKAKGILTSRLRLDEPEAFRRLRKLASNGNQKLVEVARAVIASEEVFQALDQAPPPAGPYRHAPAHREDRHGRAAGSHGS